MSQLTQDLRLAVRQLVRSPGFAIVALLTLVLGIGVNTTMFTVVSAVLYRPLPVEQPDRLVRIYTSEWEQSGIPTRFFGASSYPDVVDLRTGLSDVLSGLAAFTVAGLGITGDPAGTRLTTAFVTDDFLSIYGVHPTRGRGLASSAQGGDAGSEVVITDRVWREQLGGTADVLGRSVVLAGDPYTIVGVVPAEALAPLQDQGVDALVSVHAYPRIFAAPELMEERDTRWLDVVGRLRPGVSTENAQDALTVAGQRIGEANPAESGDRRYTLRAAPTLIGFAGSSADDIARMAIIVMIVVGRVLLIACANLANLLLTRASRRRREIAIRLSLGASRARVVRQLLTESLVLAVLGGFLATLAAIWATDLFALLPLPAGIAPTVDVRVLAYTGLIAVAAGFIFGLAPALHGTRAALVHAMQHDGGRTVASGRSRLRTSLVVAQIALSFVLLVSGALLGRTLMAIRSADPGFAAERVLVAGIDLDPRRFDATAARAMHDCILERTAAIPGVEHASLSTFVAFSGQRSRMSITVPGHEPAPGERMGWMSRRSPRVGSGPWASRWCEASDLPTWHRARRRSSSTRRSRTDSGRAGMRWAQRSASASVMALHGSWPVWLATRGSMDAPARSTP